MKIALAQMSMTDKIEENLNKSLNFCDKAKDCDLLFFPEIQLSPFFPQYRIKMWKSIVYMKVLMKYKS